MTHDLRRRAQALLVQALADPAATFRDGQLEAIEILLTEDPRLLLVQRTGWGKSIVYFLVTKMLREQGSGPTLLVSPLLSLMRNQIDAAGRIGLKAVTINSTNQDDWKPIEAELLDGRADILLVSPERLANDQFREEVLMQLAGSVGLLVVDEAHCISDWGHDFRPDYRRVTRVLQAMPRTVRVLATTATANDRVVADVAEQIGADVRILRGPLTRKSLALQTLELPSQSARLAWLAEHVPELPGSGIIYTLTQRDAERVAEWLRRRGVDALAYHAGMQNEIREDLEQRLLANEVKALVATVALGMGFDKPDLGFVIHFQRHGSAVHYYQQVGRAGRAVDTAYGILLSGREDEDITEYFIQTAFPPQRHVKKILEALEGADDGMSLQMLERRVNLRRTQIEKALKILAVEDPAPVVRNGYRWHATAATYLPDHERIEHLTQLRLNEQARMAEYMATDDCLMSYLAAELDDPHVGPCGRCSSCAGGPLVPETYSIEAAAEAAQFLRKCDQPIEPRKQWPPGLDVEGLRGNIGRQSLAEEGRALCSWGDGGWGELVKRGKQVDGTFSDLLVDAVVDLVRDRWKPSPAPAWVTCVPSLRQPELVPGFAQRVAAGLGLPFVPSVRKTCDNQPQKVMENSWQQASNVASAFSVEGWPEMGGAVLLIDDVVDSRWTFTVVAALLREAAAATDGLELLNRPHPSSLLPGLVPRASNNLLLGLGHAARDAQPDGKDAGPRPVGHGVDVDPRGEQLTSQGRLTDGVIAGYDPGGDGHHGVAILSVLDGVPTRLETETLRTAEDVAARLAGLDALIGIGVDTLTCWSTGPSGWRPADRWLRERYAGVLNSVASPNSLFGSMGLNGMAVLMAARESHPSLVITETHPKVLCLHLLGEKYDYVSRRAAMDTMLAGHLAIPSSPANDHEWDAALSALALYEGLSDHWSFDLHALPSSGVGDSD